MQTGATLCEVAAFLYQKPLHGYLFQILQDISMLEKGGWAHDLSDCLKCLMTVILQSFEPCYSPLCCGFFFFFLFCFFFKTALLRCGLHIKSPNLNEHWKFLGLHYFIAVLHSQENWRESKEISQLPSAPIHARLFPPLSTPPPHQNGTIVITDDPTLTHRKHLKSIDYLRIHSWFCTLCALDKCVVTSIIIIVSSRVFSLP